MAPLNVLPQKEISNVSFYRAQKLLNSLLPSNIFTCATEHVAVAQALGRYLAQDVVAEYNRPDGDISAMDGYAVASEDLEPLKKTGLPLANIVCRAGEAPLKHKTGTASPIWTGAYLPYPSDRVIPLEYIVQKDHFIYLKDKSYDKRNVRYQGEEFSKGDVLIKSGTLIDFRHIALLASQGMNKVNVRKSPIIGLLSNGWELNSRAPQHCFDINMPMLRAMVGAMKLPVIERTVDSDQPALLKKALDDLIDKADIVITTGGISVGQTDNIFQTLQKLGARLVFRRVEMKPGRPMTVTKYKKSVIFSLPGNPGAAVMCMRAFVLPFIDKFQGGHRFVSFPELFTGRLTFPFEAPAEKTCLLLVHCYEENNEIWFNRVKTKGASDISAFSRGQAIALIHEGKKYQKGDNVQLMRLSV